MKLEMKPIDIPKKFRVPLIIALGVFILVGGYFGLLKSQFAEKEQLRSEYNKAQTEFNRLVNIKNNIGRTRTEYAQLRSRLDDAMRQMPDEKEVPSLLRQVSLAAHESKARIKYFAPRPVQAVDFYSELPFEIRYSGQFHNIGYFFDGIKRLERIVHVTSFTLESKEVADKVILDGTCIAKAYILPKQQIVDTPKEAKKEGKDAPPKR
jgi:type IV pilus assembly protein PilO